MTFIPANLPISIATAGSAGTVGQGVAGSTSRRVTDYPGATVIINNNNNGVASPPQIYQLPSSQPPVQSYPVSQPNVNPYLPYQVTQQPYPIGQPVSLPVSPYPMGQPGTVQGYPIGQPVPSPYPMGSSPFGDFQGLFGRLNQLVDNLGGVVSELRGLLRGFSQYSPQGIPAPQPYGQTVMAPVLIPGSNQPVMMPVSIPSTPQVPGQVIGQQPGQLPIPSIPIQFPGQFPGQVISQQPGQLPIPSIPVQVPPTAVPITGQVPGLFPGQFPGQLPIPSIPVMNPTLLPVTPQGNLPFQPNGLVFPSGVIPGQAQGIPLSGISGTGQVPFGFPAQQMGGIPGIIPMGGSTAPIGTQQPFFQPRPFQTVDSFGISPQGGINQLISNPFQQQGSILTPTGQIANFMSNPFETRSFATTPMGGSNGFINNMFGTSAFSNNGFGNFNHFVSGPFGAVTAQLNNNGFTLSRIG
jgi:hypothetical protein